MATPSKQPDFDDPNLSEVVGQLDDGDIDLLPFGAVRLDSAGEVTYFSAAERRLSGWGSRRRLGLNFYRDIAPCMDNENFRARIDGALANGSLDIEFTHIGDFEDADRELTVRAKSASDGGYWLFIRRD